MFYPYEKLNKNDDIIPLQPAILMLKHTTTTLWNIQYRTLRITYVLIIFIHEYSCTHTTL